MAPLPDPGMAGVGGLDFSVALSRYRSGDNSLVYRQQSTLTDLDELIAASQEQFKKKKKMSQPELGELAARVMKLAEDGRADLPTRIAKLLARYKIERPTVTVEYDVSVEADAKKLVGRFFGQEDKNTTTLPILRDAKGVLRPGRMTLLLGPPGAGKSTLLKALAGRLKPSKTLRVKAEVKYNGHRFYEFVVEKTAAFIDQLDDHIAALTVAETLRFAFNCQVGFDQSPLFNPLEEVVKAARQQRTGADGEEQNSDKLAGVFADPEEPDSKEFESLMRQIWGTGVKWEVVMRMVGLDVVRDTLVGGINLRGISGGQRKRLTTAEMAVGATCVMMMDEISTGLDSATLFSIISSLQSVAHSMQLTVLISLLQPPPETVAQFDDVIVLTDGLVLYHGPVNEAVPFFESLGFRCPLRKDKASFLQEVTTPAGQHAFCTPELLAAKGIDQAQAEHTTADERGLEERKLLVSLEEMSEAFFTQSPHGQQIVHDLNPENRFRREQSHPKVLIMQKYALGWLDQLTEVTARQWLLVLRDKVLLQGRLIQVVIMALIIGSLYFDIPNDQSGVRRVFGSGFVSLIFLAMGNVPQLSITLLIRSVWYKHRDSYFFGASNYSLALTASQAPVTVMEVVLFGSICYFMCGYTAEAGRFFTYLAILLFNTLSFSSLFRMLASACPDMVTANTLGGTVVLILMLTSGFAILKRDIPDWWIWAYWISPMSYGLKAIATNELTSSNWDDPFISPNGTVFPGITQGEAGLRSFSFPTSRKWTWIGCVFNFGFTTLMVVLAAIAFWSITGFSNSMAMVADEEGLKRQRAAAKERREAMKKKENAQGGRASSIEFTPITITMIDLKYFVPNPSRRTDPSAPKELQLLTSITGSIRPGVLTALMGGSGAGKTTLMDVIAMRKTVGRIEGEVLVNGHEQEKRTWSRNMGYAEQFDIHSAQLTVKEALAFSAKLRLPSELSEDQVLGFVDQTLETVDLMEAMDRMVGKPGDATGLGLDQRKRLTIGVELVANPSVLFCDEPTSGLDARAAATVMTAVKNVSRQGRTVVVTIHQPSIDIFENFDALVLLHRGGLVDYIGPLGAESSDLIEYLSSYEGVTPIAPGYNPATWMLEVTGGATSASVKAAEHDFAECYKQHELGKKVREEALADTQELPGQIPKLPMQGRYATTWATQARQMISKFSRVYWRSPTYNLTRMLMTLICVVIVSTMYVDKGNLPSDNVVTGDIQAVLGALFLANTFSGMTNLMAVMPIMSAEREVYYRERAASMYHSGVFPWAQQAVELPYLFAQAVLFVPAAYFIIGFKHGAEEFFFFFLMFFLATAMYTYFGACLAIALPSQGLAMVVAGGMNSLFNIFNGFSISFDDIPAYWKWLNRLVPTTWILYGLAASQLGDSDTRLIDRDTTVSQYLEDQFGYKYSFRWVCILIIAAWLMAFRVGAVLALKYINYENR